VLSKLFISPLYRSNQEGNKVWFSTDGKYIKNEMKWRGICPYCNRFYQITITYRDLDNELCAETN
jgi:hypothetical protein